MTEPLRVLGPEPVAPMVSHRLSRRQLLAGMGVIGLGALTGCTASTPRMADSPAADGSIESKLNLYTWGDYDDPRLLDEFKDAENLVLQVDSFGSNEEMIAKLAAARGTSGYDVVVPTGLMIPQMVRHNLLQPWDMELIPNFSNIDPEFAGRYFDPENTYSICKAWGTTGFVYDTEVITGPMESWSDFIDAAQNEADGRTALLEDPWEVCSIALGTQGVSLNTTDRSGAGGVPTDRRRGAGPAYPRAPGQRGHRDGPGDGLAAAGLQRRCASGDARGRRGAQLALRLPDPGGEPLDGQLVPGHRCAASGRGPRLHRSHAQLRGGDHP